MDDLTHLQDPTHTAPTELEMIMACQAHMARINVANFVAFRDTVGAKPVDESKIDHQINNPYEELTDEELEMILAAREAKEQVIAQQIPEVASSPASGDTSPLVTHEEEQDA